MIESLHISSHRNLVARLDTIAPEHRNYSLPKIKLNAVIVPTSNRDPNFSAPIHIAKVTGAQLVIFTSGDATPDIISKLLLKLDAPKNSNIIHLPDGYTIPDLLLATARHGVPGDDGTRDTTIKRNVGLALARMLKWQYVWFIDDDVSNIYEEDIYHTLNGFDANNINRRIVGWALTNPTDSFGNDNSTVMHANRLVGEFQDTFISAGALAIKVDKTTSFFPNIYNADWLICAAALREGKDAIAIAGDVNQISKNPFKRTNFTKLQEFGDVLVDDGIYRFLQISSSLYDQRLYSIEWWKCVELKRLELITTIIQKLKQMPEDDTYLEAINSLEMVIKIHQGDWPELLASYFKCWIEDISVHWPNWFNNLPLYDINEITNAAEYLNLDVVKIY